MRALIDRIARHAVTTTLAAALLVAAAGAAIWLHPTGAEPHGQVVTLDGWPRDGASATVWLDNGRQVDVALGVPTTLDGPVQAAVLTRASSDPMGWAECSITVDGVKVSADRVEMPDAPASCAWPQ